MLFKAITKPLCLATIRSNEAVRPLFISTARFRLCGNRNPFTRFIPNRAYCLHHHRLFICVADAERKVLGDGFGSSYINTPLVHASPHPSSSSIPRCPPPRPPTMSSPDEIAASLTRIYRLFVDIGYLSEADLKLAPHGPEELRADLCRQVGMNATAIAFLEKIPWASAGSGDLIPNSEMIDFSEPHCLRAARNPHAPGHESRKGLDGRFLSLTFCGEKGHALVVDTVRGKCSVFSVQSSMSVFWFVYFHADTATRYHYRMGRS